MLYHYKAEILSVYDGDTVTATIDLGFCAFLYKVKLRLHGIDTPEMRASDPDEKAKAYAARDFVRERVLGRTVQMKSLGKGKYGRYLSILWVLDDDGNPEAESLNDQLIRLGHAKAYLC